jgi:hypothetical protein
MTAHLGARLAGRYLGGGPALGGAEKVAVKPGQPRAGKGGFVRHRWFPFNSAKASQVALE